MHRIAYVSTALSLICLGGCGESKSSASDRPVRTITVKARTLTDRLQGYRVHINPAGSSALHACLPPDLFGAFDRTCGKPGRAMHFLDEQMRVLFTIDGDMVEQRDQVADPSL